MQKSKLLFMGGCALCAIGAFLLTMDGFHFTQDSIYSIGNIIVGAIFVGYSYKLKAREENSQK